MMNTKTLIISVSAALGLILLMMPAQAEVINNTHWLVKSGDTVYSIARKIHPGDVKKQVRFRRQLVNVNPQVFAGNSNSMSVGSKLVLPKSAITQQKPKPQIKATRIAQKVVTPDPEDVIGKVVINIGELKATNRSATRRLSRHSDIINGDTLKTASNTRAQIRLKDGALISLQPNTEFKIAEYNFNGKEDGTERGIYELIKGGFRTITGLIGHKNKQNYKVRTTVATIGIRGTHYGLMLCEASSCAADNLADGLYGGVIDGSVAIDNGTGQQLFNNDQYFHIASAQDVPVEIMTPPPVFNGAPGQPGTTPKNNPDSQRMADNQVRPQTPPMLMQNNATSDPVRLNTTDQANQTYVNATETLQAPVGAGVMISFNYMDNAGQHTGVSGAIPATSNNQILLQIPSGQLEKIPFALHEAAINPSAQGFYTHDLLVTQTAQLNDLGSNANLKTVWGRWTGNFAAAEDGVALDTKDHLHFVYSENLTSPAQLANLGGLGSNQNYLTTNAGGGATLTTDSLGGVGGVNSFDITMDFINQQMTNYSVTSTPTTALTTAGITTVSAGTTAPVNFNNLNNFTIQEQGTWTCTSAACTGDASVAFVGAQAEGVVTSYTMTAGNGAVSYSGAGLATR